MMKDITEVMDTVNKLIKSHNKVKLILILVVIYIIIDFLFDVILFFGEAI